MPSQRPYGSAAIRSASAGGVGCEPVGAVLLAPAWRSASPPMALPIAR